MIKFFHKLENIWIDNSFLSILASLAMLLILVIHFSSAFRLFLYEIYQKIKKFSRYPVFLKVPPYSINTRKNKKPERMA